MSISAENCKKASKSCFYKWIFRKQKKIFTISKAYQCDPKHHKNIIEIHFEHMWSSHSFWRHFFETHTSDFFKTFEDGHFGQKTQFFAQIFFEPPNFLAQNIPTATKLRPDIRSILNLCQKNLCDHLIGIDEKIWKNRPPLSNCFEPLSKSQRDM